MYPNLSSGDDWMAVDTSYQERIFFKFDQYVLVNNSHHGTWRKQTVTEIPDVWWLLTRDRIQT